MLPTPWLIVGEFNAIKDSFDRLDSSNIWLPSFNEFDQCLAQASLDDLRYVGHRFTWSTSSSAGHIQRKIDKSS